MKLRATVTVEYDADPQYYDTADPKEMAAIDQASWATELVRFACSFEQDEFEVVVEPVE